MAKTVDSINRGLKLKAKPTSGNLTIKIGRNKYTLPFETRLLESSSHLFVHIPPSAATFKLADGSLELVEDANEAVTAQKSFRTPRTGRGAGRKSAKEVEIPAELQKALQAIPAGYKLAFGADGSPRIVKTRKRGKK